jgi:hypothetical protein
MQVIKDLTTRIARLSPAQQEIVGKFVEKLEGAGQDASVMTLDQAIDEFELEHPELLCLLAQ